MQLELPPRQQQPAQQVDDFLAFDGAEGGDSTLFDVTKYLGAIRRRWPLILICTLIAIAYALIRFSLSTKMYQATTMIQIERRQLSTIAMGGQTNWLEEWWNLEYYPTQYRLLRSRGMAERVVRNLRLLNDPGFTGRKASLVPQGTDGPTTAADDDAQLAVYANRLKGGLIVAPVRDTQLVELTFRWQTAELAARVANGYAEAFIEWGIETRNTTVGKASSYLSDQIDTLSQELEGFRNQLSSYNLDGDFVLDPAGEALNEREKTLQKKYNDVVADRIAKEAAYKQLESMPDDVAINTIASSSVTSLQNEVYQLEQEYQAKLESFRPEWPAMVSLRSDIEKKKSELRGLTQGTVRDGRARARTAYQQALREERTLEAELRELNIESSALNSTALEYNNLRTKIETRQELLNELVKRQSETEIASRIQDSQDSNVRIVDRAVEPGGPYRPVLKRDLSAALLLGLLAGAGLVFLIEFFDRTIKSPEELEKLTGLPILTVIPDLSNNQKRYGGYLNYGSRYGYNDAYGYGYGRSRGKARAKKSENDEESRIELLPHRKPRLAVCEAYRSLRTALLLSSAEELKTIAVTSAEPSEGKTATTANLAVVMAQLGRNVLVIDCDLRRPRMHKVFKASNRTGVVNHLTGTETADSLVQQTEVPNLYLIPSGPIPPNPSELLASDRMRELVAALRSRFDYVLIDTPPVLPVIDAAIVGQLVDGIAICARAGHLVRDHAKGCRERLRFHGIRLLGTIMNRYSPGGGSRYAKQYYYAETYEDDSTRQATTAA